MSVQKENPRADKIQTERLTLVPLTMADVEALFVIAQDPASIEDFQHTAKTLADVEEWVGWSVEGSTLAWTVRLDGVVIGLVEADIKKGAIADVGYFMDARQQNKGYATEAVGAMVEWLFASTPVHRIESGVTARNAPSRRVVEKLGFVLEGISRKNWFWDDEWHDSANYALLREGWSAL